MTEHTNEPWAIDPDDRKGMEWNNQIVSASNPDRTICFMSHDGTEENIECQANASRIVACVNACGGIETEALESFAGRMILHSGVELWMSYCDKKEEVAELKQQCDELLAALETMSHWHGDDRFDSLIAKVKQP